MRLCVDSSKIKDYKGAGDYVDRMKKISIDQQFGVQAGEADGEGFEDGKRVLNLEDVAVLLQLAE